MAEEKKSALDVLLGAVSLKWIRPLIHNLGGRKVAVGGGGLAVIMAIVNSGMSDWAMAVCCASVAVICVGTSFSVAHEDAKKKEEPK